MCILTILYKSVRNVPILVAQNREEFTDRPTQAPRIQSGKPRAVCGIDRKAGGTWLGVNQHGMFAAVANRPKTAVPSEPRSRGLLCRELLTMRNVDAAVAHATRELATGAYDGANYIVADANRGVVIYGGNQFEVVELESGLYLMTNGNLNDHNDQRQEFIRRQLTLQKLDSSVTFLAVASRAFSRKPDASGRRGVVITGADYGTVSSTLLSLSDKTQNAIYQYCSGPPCDNTFDDCSALLRQVLSTDKDRSKKQ